MKKLFIACLLLSACSKKQTDNEVAKPQQNHTIIMSYEVQNTPVEVWNYGTHDSHYNYWPNKIDTLYTSIEFHDNKIYHIKTKSTGTNKVFIFVDNVLKATNTGIDSAEVWSVY